VRVCAQGGGLCGESMRKARNNEQERYRKRNYEGQECGCQSNALVYSCTIVSGYRGHQEKSQGSVSKHNCKKYPQPVTEARRQPIHHGSPANPDVGEEIAAG
jgi:hypothetical protein